MSKIYALIILFLFTIHSFALPNYITIQKESGISLREQKDPKSTAIGAVYDLYTYPVIDGQKTYVKVKINNGEIGWAWVGKSEERFLFKSNEVRSIVDYNIPVYKTDNDSEQVGLIQPNESVELLKIWHSRLKVKAPGNKVGWIYAGKYNDSWVQFSDESLDYSSLYVDFSSDNVVSNIDVEKKYANYSKSKKSLELMSSEQSEVKLKFNVSKDTNNIRLLMTHMGSSINSLNASISIKVNNKPLMKIYNPDTGSFKTDVFNINHLIQIGENQLSIELEKSKVSYFIQSISIETK